MENFETTARVRVLENTVLHVKRVVPTSGGKISVRVGDEVLPGDVLGTGEHMAGFMVVRIASELKVGPKQVPKLLKRQVGQTIYEGELLAENPGTFGLGKKILLSPVDGLIDFYDPQSGDVRLKLMPKTNKIASGVFGIVDKVDKTTGEIVIRTQASLVYGVFGSGREREGMIQVLGMPGDLISSKQITAELSGKIVIGGGVIFLDAIEKARNVGISGMITGGINAEDYKTTSGGEWFPIKKRWSDIGLTLIVTEGFGAIPIGTDIFTVLQKFHGRYGIVDGNRGRVILPSHQEDCMINIRKVKLPMGLGVEPTSVTKITSVKAGMKARVISPLYLGVQGIVESVDKTPTVLPSGLSAFLVTVATQQQKMRIPLENLEIIL